MKKEFSPKQLNDEQFVKNDAELARIYGVSKESIMIERIRRNIPNFIEYRKQLLDESDEK